MGRAVSIIVVFSAMSAMAATYYVKPDGGELKNCIIAFNTVCGKPEAADYWNSDTTLSAANYSNCCSDQVNAKFTAANHCIAADPKFVDPAHGDFRLAAGSPCINAGLDAEWMSGKNSKDLADVSRIFGEHVDVGCYEWWLPPGMVIFFR